MGFLVVIGCVTACVSAAPFYGLVAHPNGAVVPADEPAVAAARAEHLSAKGVVAHAAYAAAPVAHAAVPAVAHAAVPAAAPVAAYAAAPAVAYHTGYAGPLNLNTQLVAHPNGAVVPVDEPAVAAARAEHLTTKGAVAHAAYAAAPVAAVPAVAPVAAAPAAYAAAPAAYAAVPAVPVAPAHYGLVAHPNGAVVPADEPAVAEARAAHLNALAHAGH